jgi:hypothetical protein
VEHLYISRRLNLSLPGIHVEWTAPTHLPDCLYLQVRYHDGDIDETDGCGRAAGKQGAATLGCCSGCFSKDTGANAGQAGYNKGCTITAMLATTATTTEFDSSDKQQHQCQLWPAQLASWRLKA